MCKAAFGLLLLIPAGYAADGSPANARLAAQKAIGLVQQSQKAWFAKQSCSSCHHQVLPALAFRDAREHGIPVDETLARADADKAFASLSNLDRAVQYTHQIDAPLDNGYQLLAAEAAGVRPSLVTAVYARHIANRQKADGHWTTIDERPPQSYSSITATAVALRAIQHFHHPSLEQDARERLVRGSRWLREQKPASTEESSFRLLGLWWTGASEKERAAAAAELAGRQKDDGGWNSVNGRASDAYSTAEALVALTDAGGVATTDARWRRGLQFLLDSQQPDGSWRVSTRLMPPVPVSPPYLDTGYPSGHDQFISIMAASWAIRALARAAGPGTAVPLPTLQAAVPSVEPWMETVLFGRAADVEKLLRGGWSAKSATRDGTTALMMAIPDVEKAKLLLDKGADVNARSKTKYSALLVAALYPQSKPAIEMLLSRGASMRLAKGQGAPLFNATGIAVATISGFPELVSLFASKGERPTEKYLMLGMFSSLPVSFAVTAGDAETLKAVLDAGLPADTVDDDGLTLLSWAAIANRLDVARLLIARRANVNHVDRFGMTPIQHAASIDFGDGAMIELLRGAGARIDQRTKEGLTALDLARKYGHQNLLRSLGGL